MKKLEIQILDPKAQKLLEQLADMKLIKIQDKGSAKKELAELLNKLRAKDIPLSMDEITKEVKIVRAKRYAEKKAQGGI